MKKIVNLTRNEVEDVLSEETDGRLIHDEFFTQTASTTYRLAHARPKWKGADDYKIIEP